MAPADTIGTDTLTGVWHGQYDYPAAFEPVHFVATIIDVGGQISGTTHETTSHRGATTTRLAAMYAFSRSIPPPRRSFRMSSTMVN